MTSKYDRLADHLATLGGTEIALTFAEVAAVVGPLPVMARRDAKWWSAGDERYARYGHVHDWRRAGFVAERPDFAAETVTFRRVGTVDRQRGRDMAWWDEKSAHYDGTRWWYKARHFRDGKYEVRRYEIVDGERRYGDSNQFRTSPYDTRDEADSEARLFAAGTHPHLNT